MKNTNNESYNTIVEFIKSNPLLHPEDKRNLMKYATQLYINGIENKKDESIEDILNDLKELNDFLIKSESTSVVAKRINQELQLMERIGKYYQDGCNLERISYELDKLYLESDLGVRKNSSLSYNLRKTKRGKNL